MSTQSLIDDPLVPQRAVKGYRGDCSDMTIYRDIARGVLPPPTKINGRNYWRRSVVIAAYSQKGEAA